MNAAYLIYQAERTRTAAEQRAVDTTHAELAASLTRLWHSLAAPLRSRHGASAGRSERHGSSRRVAWPHLPGPAGSGGAVGQPWAGRPTCCAVPEQGGRQVRSES